MKLSNFTFLENHKQLKKLYVFYFLNHIIISYCFYFINNCLFVFTYMVIIILRYISITLLIYSYF